jgi:hypothetical protein
MSTTITSPPQTDWQTSLSRWACVLRYHRPAQLAHRAWRRLEHRGLVWTGARKYHQLAQQAPPPLREAFDVRPLFDARLAAASQRLRHQGRAAAILAGQFTYLNQQHHLPDPIDWDWTGRAAPSLLWRFHLHYQDELFDLAARAEQPEGPADDAPTSADPAACLRRAADLVRQWIAGNRPGSSRALADAWHPYCIARRLPNWIMLKEVLDRTAIAPPEEMLSSLFAQAQFLADHLEWDLGGNHLLENLKSLLLAGAFFSGETADGWLDRSDEWLRDQLDEQILPHGEHFERSPMYHAQMLQLVLDVRDAARTLRPALAERCNDAAQTMAAFLAAIRHPDGRIPLWGDSTYDGCPGVDALLARAVAPEQTDPPGNADESPEPTGEATAANLASAAAVGPYWIWRDDRSMLTLDAGPVGPDHLPGHAHADLLSVEASLGGRPLLVDSGVFGYDDDPMRRYCRSTAAHNALEIDGTDQCDMWSRFRMGCRGRPTALQYGRKDEAQWCRAAHNAYRRLGVDRVDRWLVALPEGPWICVDRAQGRAVHRLRCRLSLHPEIEVQPIGADRFELIVGRRRARLQFLAPGDVQLTTGWYCPRFGQRIETAVLQWSAEVSLPFACGWALDWCRPACDVSLARCDANRLVLCWTRSADRAQLSIDAATEPGADGAAPKNSR